MKKMFFLLLSTIFLLQGCNHDESLTNSQRQQLVGAWLCTEGGFSDGANYITKPVAAFPAQTMEFKKDSTIVSTVNGWESYKFYRLSIDSIYHEKVITLYLHDPDFNKGIDGLAYSYVIDDDGLSLKMYFRWCIEGCHVGFKRLE